MSLHILKVRMTTRNKKLLKLRLFQNHENFKNFNTSNALEFRGTG